MKSFFPLFFSRASSIIDEKLISSTGAPTTVAAESTAVTSGYAVPRMELQMVTRAELPTLPSAKKKPVKKIQIDQLIKQLDSFLCNR